MNRYTQKMQEIGAEQLGVREGFVFPSVSEEKMAEVERELGASLPPDYREFVRGYGFYSVNNPLFSFQRNGETYTTTINRFRGISQQDSYRDLDIVHYRLDGDFEEWSPAWIAIASAGSASIAYAFTGSDVGKVFYFTTDGQYELVANSFDEFIQLLQPDDAASCSGSAV